MKMISLKKIRAGVLIYRLYYQPKGFILKYLQRDPINRYIDEVNRRRMEAAVSYLKPISLPKSKKVYDIHFLSGKRFWYQTCFCAYSMIQHSNICLRPVIYDDGTLTVKNIQGIQGIFPDSVIVSFGDIEAKLDQFLPVSRYPFLRGRRLVYPNLRKLTDIHAGSAGWKLVLDSDMLFFRKPTFLINWLQIPQHPCYMLDAVSSYGYSDRLMSALAQAKIPERVNVGICGLKSDEIDWQKMEHWCKEMIEREKAHYYQEQALVAMLVAGKPCQIASAEDYVVMPKMQEVMRPEAVLHHYVANSKPWYFRYGWRLVQQSTFLEEKIDEHESMR